MKLGSNYARSYTIVAPGKVAPKSGIFVPVWGQSFSRAS